MKKHIFTLLVILCSHVLIAQTHGCLIIKEYSPDEWQVLHERQYFDMNDDGISDFFYGVKTSSFYMKAPEVIAMDGGCFYCVDSSQYHSVNNFFVDLSIPFNDTSLNYDIIIYNEKNWIGHYHLDTLRYKAAIRNGSEGEYYYGWLEAYSVVTYNYDSVWFYLARTGFCTIPNYPLKWGQTSLTEDVDETEANYFVTLHPNPTNGQVTITGQDLKSAEVFNALGQCVATIKGKGEQMTVDISNLPAGVYFVNITDGEGRKCVRKVVKE